MAGGGPQSGLTPKQNVEALASYFVSLGNGTLGGVLSVGDYALQERREEAVLPDECIFLGLEYLTWCDRKVDGFLCGVFKTKSY